MNTSSRKKARTAPTVCSPRRCIPARKRHRENSKNTTEKPKLCAVCSGPKSCSGSRLQGPTDKEHKERAETFARVSALRLEPVRKLRLSGDKSRQVAA